MSQSHPVSNPFGAGPSYATSDVQNPFQIVGGDQPARTPSPFDAASNRPPFGARDVKTEVPPPREVPQAEANPFQIAEGGGPPAVQTPQATPQSPPVGGMAPVQGGFEMKGFPPGPAPMNQLEAAPVGGGDGEQHPPTADPFAGMDLPQVSEESGGEAPAEAAAEEAPVADFAVAEPEAKPEAKSEPAPEKKASKQKRASFVPAKPSGGREVVNNETKQLELRAIFGVDHELSAQEILQRARGLPGIMQVAKVSNKEAQALGALQGCATKLGLDEDVPIMMSCPDGFIDFLHADDTALAVLRSEDYRPGVRATLIIVARELGKL